MRLIDRYLLRHHLVPVAYCLCAFSLLFVLFDLFDRLAKILDAQAPWHMIALYYLAILSPSFEVIAPASLLLGTLYALWNLTRHNEITALRAGGQSFLRILLPFVGVGLAFSFATAAVKEVVAPPAYRWAKTYAKNGFRNLRRQMQVNTLYYNDAARRVWSIGVFDWNRPRVFYDVKITQERPNGSRVKELVADRAEWLDGRWWFRNLRVNFYDPEDNPVVGQPLAAPQRALCEVEELDERPRDFLEEITPWELLNARQMRRYLQRHTALTPDLRLQKIYDIHARLAIPWACLVVTLFAVPVGAGGRRHNPLAGIFLAVGCFFAYYAFSQVGLFLARRQMISPWLGAWLSNIIFLAAGLRMLLKTR